ncbi:hypothetical protein DXA95_12280 [Odoribacter sp. OF09-27XD]|nr:hypothetical protein [Odoribacter sp. OF09-27XD]RHV92575.1 hypothetical protein DXA95_12280 [Odoribacter sp. OF09-27XD]
MSNSEYYKELTIYRLTDYEWNKRMDIQAEKTKEWGVKTLERMVNMLKEKIPQDKIPKMGKVVRLGR